MKKLFKITLIYNKSLGKDYFIYYVIDESAEKAISYAINLCKIKEEKFSYPDKYIIELITRNDANVSEPLIVNGRIFSYDKEIDIKKYIEENII